MFIDYFYVTCGSIQGSSHRIRYKNNQDALYIRQKNDTLCAVVCDGCSGSKHSEIGAGLISRYIVNECLKLFNPISGKMTLSACEKSLADLGCNTLCFISGIVEELGINLEIAIQDMFLFTVLGVVMDNDNTFIFNAGDGSYVINDTLYRIEQENKPQYISYGLIQGFNPAPFHIQALIETQKIDNLMLSSDGLDYLLRNSEKLLRDGKVCGGYEQFLNDERYINNLSLLQKRLVVLGGLNSVLKDDTSIILIRRRNTVKRSQSKNSKGVEEEV